MSRKEKKSGIITIDFILKNEFLHKYVVSLLLLAMILNIRDLNAYSCRVFDFKQFDTKRNYLEQKIRVENWILHKHLLRSENGPPCWDAILIDPPAPQRVKMLCQV